MESKQHTFRGSYRGRGGRGGNYRGRNFKPNFKPTFPTYDQIKHLPYIESEEFKEHEKRYNLNLLREDLLYSWNYMKKILRCPGQIKTMDKLCESVCTTSFDKFYEWAATLTDLHIKQFRNDFNWWLEHTADDYEVDRDEERNRGCCSPIYKRVYKRTNQEKYDRENKYSDMINRPIPTRSQE